MPSCHRAVSPLPQRCELVSVRCAGRPNRKKRKGLDLSDGRGRSQTRLGGSAGKHGHYRTLVVNPLVPLPSYDPCLSHDPCSSCDPCPSHDLCLSHDPCLVDEGGNGRRGCWDRPPPPHAAAAGHPHPRSCRRSAPPRSPFPSARSTSPPRAHTPPQPPPPPLPWPQTPRHVAPGPPPLRGQRQQRGHWRRRRHRHRRQRRCRCCRRPVADGVYQWRFFPKRRRKRRRRRTPTPLPRQAAAAHSHHA